MHIKKTFVVPWIQGKKVYDRNLFLLQQQNSPASNETWRPFYSLMGIVCDKVICREYDTFTTDVHNHDSFLFTSEECAREEECHPTLFCSTLFEGSAPRKHKGSALIASDSVRGLHFRLLVVSCRVYYYYWEPYAIANTHFYLSIVWLNLLNEWTFSTAI